MTSWLKVSEEYSRHPPWIVKEVPDKGLAAFATRRFEKGDIICVEKPTVWCSGHHPFDDLQLNEINEKIELLSSEDKEAFYAMSNAFPDAPSIAAGIFMTNCFDMTDSPHGESCAMYLAIARLNHSCTPNVQQCHLPNTGEEILHAVRTIEIDDEINDCYIDLRNTTSDRIKLLQDIYRFTCTCNSCVLNDINDNNRRKRANIIDEQIILAASTDDGNGESLNIALTLAYDAVKLLSSNECIQWSIRYLPDAYMTLYQLYVANNGGGNNKKAMRNGKKFLQSAYDLNILLTGSDSPDSISTKQKLDSIP